MSLRNLVEDQCGTANSLVQLSSHFVQDKGLSDQGILHPFQHENFAKQEDQAASYLNNSPSFRMDSLLSEMRDLEVAALAKNTNPPEGCIDSLAKNENVSEWANQYLESGSKFSHIEENPYQSNIWSNENVDQSLNREQLSKPWLANEFDFNANWGLEYAKDGPPPLEMHEVLNNAPVYPPEITELQLVAGQVVNSMSDAKFSDSKFLKFMNQVSEGQVQLSGDEFIGVQNDNNSFNEWASVVSKNVKVDATENEKFSQWGNLPNAGLDCQHRRDTGDETLQQDKLSEDAYSKELWSRLTERWEQLNLTNQDPWNTEFSKFVASVQTYAFAEENPMADKQNALEEGKKRLEEEDLPGAILCFEAAVKQNAKSVEGWLLLGRTQAENEQDQQAIAALNQCLQEDPDYLEAWQELAVCYANENYQYQACYALKEWLAKNPKYQDIVEEKRGEILSEKNNDVTSILTMKFFNDVLNMYLKAVQQFSESGEADVDIQNGLGVLLTLNSDYDKATDCFETAVKLRPNDSRLWNRLGATLANGQKPEQALEAYRKTLKLSPGFIRARYNLGITCVHLKMYKQAVEHLLIALKQQVSGRGIHGEKSYAMSESIWTTLKLALSLSERKQLLPLAEKRDLDALAKEFGVTTPSKDDGDVSS